MKRIIALAASRSKIVYASFILLILSGITAYNNIPRETLPELAITVIYVSVGLEGVSPEDAERLVVRPLEEELQNLEGLKEMRSTAYQGGGNVILEFYSGIDADQAIQDVRAQVDRAKPELPIDALEPRISQVDFTQRPIFSVALSGSLPERTLLNLAKDLRDEFRKIPSVLNSEVQGAREEQVEIIIDPLLVEHYGLNQDELFRIFSRTNRLIAAGNLDTGNGKFAVTVPGLFETTQDIYNVPVKSTEQAVITLGDIADIRRTFKERESFVRINGKQSIAVDLSRRPNANVINTIIQAKAIVEQKRQSWPEGLNVNFPVDDTENLVSRFSSLQNSVIIAVLIVMSICMGFLGFRSGLLVGVAIPGAFLTGILVLALLGYSINALALIGLVISVGILVDGAIVVVENAERLKEEGIESQDAYVQAAQRMAWPIITSTITTLIVFLPLLFWPGNTGAFFKYLPITLISVLSAALVMALIFVPAIGASLKSNIKNSDAVGTDNFISRNYTRVLERAVDNPGKVIFSTIFFLIFIQIAYSKFGQGINFFPAQEPDSVNVAVHARGNLSLEEQDALVREVENEIIGLPGIKYIYAKSGRSPGAGASLPAPDSIGDIEVDFLAWNERRPSLEIIDEITNRTKTIPGIEAIIKKESKGPQLGQAIQIEVSSLDDVALMKTVAMIREGMEELGGFISESDTRPLPGIEWQLKVNRSEASKFNADIATIGQSVQLITKGLKLAEYRPDDSEEEIDIVVRYPASSRSIRNLDQVRVETGQGLVPISNFVKRVPVQQEGEIQRVDGVRTIKVSADAQKGTYSGYQVIRLKQWLRSQDLPENINILFKGEEADSSESSNFLRNAFIVAIFMMGIVLLLQFDSFYSVFVVLTAVVFSTAGVFLGLLVTGSNFSITMSGIGTIALAGIVVNNNIVLVDTFNRFNDGSLSLRQAIIKTGVDRFRPVLLTTATTVLGLVPTATMLNINFIERSVTLGDPVTLWWSFMTQAIIYGLIFATVLTLIVTPCMLMARKTMQEWSIQKINDLKETIKGYNSSAAAYLRNK